MVSLLGHWYIHLPVWAIVALVCWVPVRAMRRLALGFFHRPKEPRDA